MPFPGTGLILGVLFLACSCLALFSMLHLLGVPRTRYGRTLRVVHRVGGGVAIALYLVTSVLFLSGVARQTAGVSTLSVLHLVFAALFVPFVLIKIVIVEKYPELRSKLFGIGIVLFATVFVMFLTSAAGRFGLTTEDARGPEAPSDRDLAEVSLGRELFVVKCAKCHRLERPLTARKEPDEWARTVDEMRLKDRSWISKAEAERITRFLIFLGGAVTHD
jgi:hypothetical protein